jgi:hypothetical protein
VGNCPTRLCIAHCARRLSWARFMRQVNEFMNHDIVKALTFRQG